MATKENSETFEKSLISKFECPVCFKYMSPPIRLCVSGHSFCSHCFENLKNCALCRAKMSPNRCILLEQLHESLTFPCKYLDKGCSFSGKGSSRTNHEEYCEFSSVLCPFRSYNSCKWTGLRSEMIDHCKDVHPGNIFFQNENKAEATNFNVCADIYYYILLYIDDTLFRCSWDLYKESGLMRFAVYSLGKPSDKTLCFKIGIFLKNTNIEAVSMIGPCYPLKKDNKRFIKKKYLMTNFDMIKDLCDTSGTLHYSVEIIDRKLVLPQIIENELESE